MLSPQFSLVRVTAPSALPISVAEAKAQMRVEGNDEEEEEPSKSVEVVGDKKIIHFKPPIIVKELAAMMELRPLVLIQDLMEMEVFANLNQAIEPEIASKICEKHGFVFEKEKREKGGGLHKVEEVIAEPLPQEEPHIQPPPRWSGWSFG